MCTWAKRLWARLWQRSARPCGGAPAGAPTRLRGVEGEALARAHLAQRGYRILARNWRNPRDRREELDLVALDGAVLVFVEVKTRAAGALVSGRHAVDARKKRVLLRAARAYLLALPQRPASLRFDVVEVALPAPAAQASPAITAPGTLPAPQSPVVRHFKNLPLFPKNFR